MYLPLQDNEYIQAIKSVASVLAPYDSDQLIPAYGFGARLPPDGQVSHCFPLNFNFQRPEVYGVQVGGTCMWGRSIVLVQTEKVVFSKAIDSSAFLNGLCLVFSLL